MDDEENSKELTKSSSSNNHFFGLNNGAEKFFLDLDVERNEKDVKINKTSSANTHYDPQLMRPKSIICSEVISKTRLTTRDATLENSITETPAESDEAFFDKLKKRINGDREKLDATKTATVLPKRASIVRKRRSLFNNESLNLMKKFRREILTRKDRLSVEHGIFSMSSKNNGGQENYYATNSPKQTSQSGANNKKNSKSIMAATMINKNMSNTDQDSLCQTPFQMKKEFENLHRTSPTRSSSALSWDQVQNY